MKIKKHLLISMVLLIVMAAVTGCGSSDKGQTPEPAPAPAPVTGNEVIMQNHSFSPVEITIKKGETITWTNKDPARHDVKGANFESQLLGKDESFEQTFNQSGTFEYSCTPHPYMKGKVIVTE